MPYCSFALLLSSDQISELSGLISRAGNLGKCVDRIGPLRL